jgi:hypothetical protein
MSDSVNMKWVVIQSDADTWEIQTAEDKMVVCQNLWEDEANHIIEAHNLWMSFNQPMSVRVEFSDTHDEMNQVLLEHQRLENVRLEKEIASMTLENETAALHLRHEEMLMKQREERRPHPTKENFSLLPTNAGSSSSTVTAPSLALHERLSSLEQNMKLFQSWMQVATLRISESIMPSGEFQTCKAYLTNLSSYVDVPLIRKP